jgi:hypothetical protein
MSPKKKEKEHVLAGDSVPAAASSAAASQESFFFIRQKGAQLQRVYGTRSGARHLGRTDHPGGTQVICTGSPSRRAYPILDAVLTAPLSVPRDVRLASTDSDILRNT